MTTYVIDGDIYNAETEEEAKALYIADVRSAVPECDLSPEDVHAEGFWHCYELDGNCCGVSVLDLCRAADKALPSGFNDSTWDDDHRIVREEVRLSGRTYLLEADVIDWEPSLSFDPDGDYGSFTLGVVSVFRVR